MIKKLAVTLALALACFATTSRAAISFTAGGTGVQTFDAAPTAATGWQTKFVGSGAGTYVTPEDLDNAAQTIDRTAINGAFVTSGTVPPSTFGSNRWNSALMRLQSRTTSVGATVLLATLQNDSGASVSSVVISYEYAAMVAADSTIVEEIPGQRVYYSTSGSPGSWTRIDELSTWPVGTFTNNVSATVNIAGGWAPASPLYIIWLDDNGSASDTAPTREGGYTMDNFSVAPPGFVGVTITSPTNNASFVVGVPVTITASAASEGNVTSVSFYDGLNLLSTDTSFPFSVTTSTLTLGTHTIKAISLDDQNNQHESAAITIIIKADAPPVITAVTNDILATTHLLVGTNLTYTVLATDDRAVTNVQFFVNDELRRTDTTSAYTFLWNDITAGNKTLKIVVTDNGGLSTTTNINIIVTNVPNTDVIIANEETWKYYDEGVPTADSGWMFPTFDDSSWSNGLAQIGWGDGDERTVSRKYIGTPGAPGTITNATQLFRKKFTVANPADWASLSLHLLADDGGIVYINGTEVYRMTNMPAGPVAFGDFALDNMPDDGIDYVSTNLATSVIHAGVNTIAVEVHQNTADSSDLTFDLMLFGVKPSGTTLTISLNGNNAIIRWPGSGMLQFATDLEANTIWSDLDGPYEQVNGQNQVSIPTDVSGPRMFFRVVQ